MANGDNEITRQLIQTEIEVWIKVAMDRADDPTAHRDTYPEQETPRALADKILGVIIQAGWTPTRALITNPRSRHRHDDFAGPDSGRGAVRSPSRAGA